MRPDNNLLRAAVAREPRRLFWVDLISLAVFAVYLAGALMVAGCQPMNVKTNLNWSEWRDPR